MTHEENIVPTEIAEIENIYRMVTEFMVTYSFQFLGALLILAGGVFVANRVGRIVQRLCERNSLDVTLSNFVTGIARILVIAMVAVVALGKVGISIGPFLAAVGAISLGAGLAVQGLLSNYGAGLAIIVTRPFVVGDTISVQGVNGVVDEVGLSSTRLLNEDNVRITIPNRHIMGEIIHNSQRDRLIELGVGIAYESDPVQALKVIRSALEEMPDLSSDHPVLVGIEAFGDSSIDLGVRFWGPTQKLFAMRYEANALIFAALKEAQIHVPFPQREVRMLQEA
jgi:small conductance mechanosensitive channel